MQLYVGLSDVISWVEGDDYQTSQNCESHQLRGERPCRRGSDPAYVVRGGTPSAIVPSSEPMGSVEYINDVEFQRLDENDIPRLQGFPSCFDWQTETVTETRQLVGNAVPVGLAEAVVDELP